MLKVLITGAAGNLGSLLAVHLKNNELLLNLMIHKRDVLSSLKTEKNINIFRADLADKNSLDDALKNVDVVVHFAGLLFRHHPERFLPMTNTLFFRNILEKAREHQVRRVILISFPHVEGETFVNNPATGKLNCNPVSVHAKTRLEEEKLLFSMDEDANFEPVSLRVGMVYGKGILMIEAARWFAKYKLLGIWKKPTWIHLISTIDFLKATEQAILKKCIKGVYHLGDEGYQTLQDFLDDICVYWGYKRPWRMPVWLIYAAAGIFETASLLLGIKSPLTRDFIKIGMVSYYGDIHRMKNELLEELSYENYKAGISTN